MQVDITVVSGFLGAGKTTMIKQLLAAGAFGDSPALIENDFGSLGIDAHEFEGSQLIIKEVAAGCICCTVSGSFTAALEELVALHHPKHIIIEPSGVGKLSDILLLLANISLPDGIELGAIHTLAIVDAGRFAENEQYVREYLWDQIQQSQLVVLSKAEGVAGEEIASIQRRIEKKVGAKPVLFGSKSRVVQGAWEHLAAPEGSPAARHVEQGACAGQDYDWLDNHTSIGAQSPGSDNEHVDFQYWCTRLDRELSPENLKTLCDHFDSGKVYGAVFRAKGIVRNGNQYQIFDYVPGKLNIRKAHQGNAKGRILVIGQSLQNEKLEALFAAS